MGIAAVLLVERTADRRFKTGLRHWIASGEWLQPWKAVIERFDGWQAGLHWNRPFIGGRARLALCSAAARGRQGRLSAMKRCCRPVAASRGSRQQFIDDGPQ